MILQDERVSRRHGKPFDYFRLGKGFREGADFMRHMKASAEALLERAKREGAVRRVDRCPICEADGTEACFEVHGFAYGRCGQDDCRHGFVRTVVDERLRNEFFQADGQYSGRNYCDPERTRFRVDNIARPKVDHVLSVTCRGGGDWLDVGCGSGEILAVLKDHPGWRGKGLELSTRDAEFGRAHFGVDIRGQHLSDFRRECPQARFDVVSLFGVLHCIEDPPGLAWECADALLPGGYLVVEVANFDSMLARTVATYPDQPTRSSFNGITTLHQFTEASIRRVFAACGLEPVSVWFYGTDVFEMINQWCFSDARFPGSPLAQSLGALANDIQRVIDEREQSSNMLWIARKPG